MTTASKLLQIHRIGKRADLFHHNSTDAVEMSMSMLAWQPRNPGASTDFKALMAETLGASLEELWECTFLHRIVLGDVYADLAEALLKPENRAQIESRDIKGRTPLLWSAHRGDAASIKLLIAAGANPRVEDKHNISCLQAAITSGSRRCVELMIKAGLDMLEKDTGRGQTTLHIASWVVDDPEFLALFVSNGVDVNDGDYRNVSPLQSAACLNFRQNAEYLISLGANINNQDIDGDTPILEAVRYGNPEVLKVLLDNGAEVALANKNNEDVAHIAATYGTAECVDLLASYPLLGLGVDIPNNLGITPKIAYDERVAKSPELDRAMARLFDAISASHNTGDARNDGEQAGANSEDEDDTFYDAWEDI